MVNRTGFAPLTKPVSEANIKTEPVGAEARFFLVPRGSRSTDAAATELNPLFPIGRSSRRMRVLKVPAVFDLFTLALLSGGFLLLWQNLFSLRQIASDGANQRVDVPADQNIHIAVGPEESAANEAAELASACGASDGPPGPGLLAHADPG